jgi:hypothetical protein
MCLPSGYVQREMSTTTTLSPGGGESAIGDGVRGAASLGRGGRWPHRCDDQRSRICDSRRLTRAQYLAIRPRREPTRRAGFDGAGGELQYRDSPILLPRFGQRYGAGAFGFGRLGSRTSARLVPDGLEIVGRE